MPTYLNLTARAWRHLRMSSPPSVAKIPIGRMLVNGTLCSGAAMAQSFVTAPRRKSIDRAGAIVILGFWRSGTTLLHEYLCLDDRYGYPTTYACLNPHHFAFTQRRFLARNQGRMQRVQDRMTIGFNSPQEDEFALLCLGARSPYEGLLLPQSIRKAFAVADPNDLAPAEARTWRKLFCEFYDTVSLVGGGKPLILKSPAHSYRVSTLREILPDARFIVIVRNPYEVFESMVRTYRALTQKYALGPPISDDEIRETLLAERPRFENKLANGLAGLPAERRCVVRYEDLIRNPPAVIEGLYRQLELPSFEPVRETLEAEFARRSDYVQDALRPDREWSGRLSSTWAEIFERYGYPRA